MVAEPTTTMADLLRRVVSLEAAVGIPPDDKIDELDINLNAKVDKLEKEVKAEKQLL